MTTRCSDYHVDILAPQDDKLLSKALELAFFDETATHYKVTGNKLTFYWSDAKEEDVHPLPYKVSEQNAFTFVKSWLEQMERSERGPHPDIDGDVGRGFRIVASDDIQTYVICEVYATWAEYHK